VLRVAADLLEAGAGPEEIGQNVYESVAFGYLAVSSAVLGRAALDEEASLVWSILYEADLAAAGVGASGVDGLIDDLRIAREAEVAVLLKEMPEGFKVSLRSRGGVDVGAIAAAGGGGGHHNAAGFTTAGEVADIVAGIREQLGA
jgi:phosphoesterase RecJ-like protein